jgi:CheY-like chemotaxis protein
MPLLDGLSAAREIRALPGCAELPIVAMTANALSGDRERSLAAGMNDHVIKPIEPDLLFRALLRWIDSERLLGRALPPLEGVADAGVEDAGLPSVAALPALAGVDWRQALASSGGDPARVQRRLASFAREYGEAPRLISEALAGGADEFLLGLAHNLRSGATYIGAATLARLAGDLEQTLRDGHREGLAQLATELALALGVVLQGLAQSVDAAAPSLAKADLPAQMATLAAQLAAYLRADDARAEDAVAALQATLPDGAHAGLIAALRKAVDDIEYASALALLAQLGELCALGEPEEQQA